MGDAAIPALPPSAPSSQLVEELTRLRRAYFGPLLVVLQGLRLATSVLWLAFLVGSYMDVTYPEGAVVSRAMEAARGGQVYADWRVWPHIFSPYGPLTYYPVGWLGGMIAGAGTAPHVFYILGRLQSLAAIGGMCILLAAMLRRLGWGWFTGFVVATVLLDWDPLFSFLISYRPDAPQVALSLLAIWIASGGAPTRGRMAGALLALSGSMWVKTTSWGVAAALAIWIWRGAGWRRAAAAMACFGAANLGLALLLNRGTEGRLFLNMVDSLDNGWQPLNIRGFYMDNARMPLAAMLTGLGVAAVVLRRGGDERTRVIWMSAIGTYLVATAQNLKIGADVNYYTETWTLASLGLVHWLAGLWTGRSSLPPLRRELILCGLVVPAALCDAYYGLRTVRKDLTSIQDSWHESIPSVAARHFRGPMLTTIPFLAFAGPAPPTIMDLQQYMILVERGRIDPAPLLKMIEEKRFRVVIVGVGDFEPDAPEWLSPRIKAAIWRTYTKKNPVAKLVYLEPGD